MIIDNEGKVVENQKIKADEQAEKINAEDLKLQLVALVKDVLQQKAAMRWETHKQIEDVTIDKIIEETKKLYNFVREE
jgi:predicted secreted hydrolase